MLTRRIYLCLTLCLSLAACGGEPAAPAGSEKPRYAVVPKGTTHVVLDTPAGLHGRRLKDVMKLADKVLIPLQPSVFDIFATRAFLDDLRELRDAGRLAVGLVGMRVDARTLAAEKLHGFVQALGVPMVGELRDTQNYVHLAARGLTVFDVAPGRVERDLAQWQPICDWLAR